MAITYVLKSTLHNKRYTGSSRKDDIKFRLKNHNDGKVRSTKAYRPWKVIYTEHYDTYSEARRREMFLKTGVGRKQLDEIIKNLE